MEGEEEEMMMMTMTMVLKMMMMTTMISLDAMARVEVMSHVMMTNYPAP